MSDKYWQQLKGRTLKPVENWSRKRGAGETSLPDATWVFSWYMMMLCECDVIYGDVICCINYVYTMCIWSRETSLPARQSFLFFIWKLWLLKRPGEARPGQLEACWQNNTYWQVGYSSKILQLTVSTWRLKNTFYRKQRLPEVWDGSQGDLYRSESTVFIFFKCIR